MVTNKEKNFISIVLYIYNSEDKIEVFLNKINTILYNNFEKYEIICVNDASTDNSLNIIRNFSNSLNGQVINIINMSFYQGLELSMNAGRDLAIGDFVYEFDSIYIDYNIDTIMEVYFLSLKGFDIVSAIPRTKRRKSSKIFYSIFNKYASTQYKLDTETFRILSRRAINRVHSMSKTIPYRKAIYSNCGLKLDFVIYDTIRNPVYDKGQQVKEKRRDIAIDSLILFTDIGYKVSIGMTIFMMIITIITAIYTLIIFLNKTPIAGWTTTMLLLSISFFGVFAILAIIIKYLSILIDLVFKNKIIQLNL